MKIFIQIIMSIFIINLSFAQTNYYVNSSLGSDIPSNGGSDGTLAWKTIEYAINNTINPTTDQIIIHISSGIYNLVNDQIDVDRNFFNLTLLGEGNENTIIQAAADTALSTSRVFKIYSGNNVSIKNLSIRYGRIIFPESNGGGILNDGGTLLVDYCNVSENFGRSSGPGFGGGIANLNGNLTINNSTISHNISVDSCYGAGVGSQNGLLSIYNSTISFNYATAAGGIAVISNGLDAIFNMENSTVYGNTADHRFGAIRIAIFGEQPTSTEITTNINSCTIFNNSALDWYGGIGIIVSQNFNIKNSIVTGNISNGTPDDITGSTLVPINITSGGYNILTSIYNLVINGEQNNGIGIVPGLLPLADNYSQNGTQTCALPENSPAIDQIPSTSPNGAPQLDQRGYSRIGNYDIGSYEYPDLRSLSGDYYIPQGSNPKGFPRLEDGINEFNNLGVEGTVRFLIDSDLNENGIILNREDLSVTNNLIIKPAPGKTPTITISNFPTTGNSSNQGLTFENCSYVTIDGSNTEGGVSKDLTILGNHATGIYAVGVIDNSDNITIKNVNVLYTSLSANSYGIGVDGYTGVPDKLLIQNCVLGDEVNSFRTGVGLFGNSSSTPANGQVLDNLIYAKRRGITTFYIKENIYTGNTIYILNPDANQIFYSGIYLTGSETGDTTIINNNKILKLTSNTTTTQRFSGGIVIYGNTGVVNIFNNFIATNFSNVGSRTDDKVYGIVFGSATWNGVANIFNNSIELSTTSMTGRHAGIGTEVNSNATLNLFNNIIINNQQDSVAYGIHWTNTPSENSILNSNYNNIFLPGIDAKLGRYGTTDIPNLSSWIITTNQDSSSVSKPVQFVSSTDLHLTGSSNGDKDLSAQPISWLTMDIDGDLRSSTAPYMGADESTLPVPVELVSFTASQDKNNVILKWQTSTEINSSYFSIEKRTDDIEWSSIGRVSASGNSTDPVYYIFTDTQVRSKSFYRLKQVDLDGSFTYSKEIEVNSEIPVMYTLSQNYPNPFNPKTKINFSIPFDSQVIISVYSVTGEFVTELINDNMTAGSYSIDFDGNNLASGIYIYKMIAGEFIKTQKMMLLK